VLNFKEGQFPTMALKMKHHQTHQSPGFYMWISLILCLLLPVPGRSQSHPTRVVELSNWGLESASDINFVSIGILNKPEGDEIVLYDIREQRPRVKEPEGPRGATPSLDGGTLLIDHFNQGNVNRLGGYFNVFFRIPSQAKMGIGMAPDGEPALKFSYENRKQGFAGFWVHLFNFKAPPAQRKYLDATPFRFLTFKIRGEQGGEKLQLRIADRNLEKKEDSLLLGHLNTFLPGGKVTRGWQQVWVPLAKLPARMNWEELASVVVQVSGEDKGRVFIQDLAFTEKINAPIPVGKRPVSTQQPLRTAMWLWETNKMVESRVEQSALIDFCHDRKITDLFVQIPYEAEFAQGKWTLQWEMARMRPLMRRLHDAGIRVHALDGAPKYALKKNHDRVIALIKKIIEFNQAAPRQERFVGIRFDIEPYLLREFGGVQRKRVLQEYLELLHRSRALTRSAQLVLGVDVPFWFDAYNEFFEPVASIQGRPMSEHIIDIVDNVGIMDYRTVAYGADGVIAHGADELRYAEQIRKKVFIGLETVVLPDETLYEFGSAGKGASRLWIEPLDEDRIRLHWLPSESPRPGSKTRELAQTRKVFVPSSKLTFQQLQPSDLKEVIDQAEPELRRFSSFEGFVIHSYESFRPWLQRKH
jgi:hypothetical protein